MTTPSGLPIIRLRNGADKRFKNGHSWVYSNEIQMTDETTALSAGSIVQLVRHDKKELGVGTFTPNSLIAYRGFTRTGKAPVGN